MTTPEWRTFSDPRFAVTFRHPDATPGGHPIEWANEAHDNLTTVRLTANDRRDAYFEVTRFADDSAVERQRALRANPGELVLGEPREATLAGQPAIAFSIRRGELQREAYLVQRGADFYRITFDPRISFNHELLATLQWAAD
jgi:hypothetical protein